MLSSICLAPQVYKVYKRKSAADLSWLMMGIFMVCTVCWMAYTIDIGSMYLVVSHTINGIFELGLAVLKIKYDRPQKIVKKQVD